MPETTVAAIVIGAGQKVLLTRRACPPFNGQWCLPGGHIDPRESARDAIIREVQEETDLVFEPAFFGYFDEIIPELDWHAVVLVFTGTGTGVPSGNNDEVTEIQWFSFDEARSKQLAFTHARVLDAYLSYRRAQQTQVLE